MSPFWFKTYTQCPKFISPLIHSIMSQNKFPNIPFTLLKKSIPLSH